MLCSYKSMPSFITVLLWLIFAGLCQAGDVCIVISGQLGNSLQAYRFSITNLALTPLATQFGDTVPETTSYGVRNRHLTAGTNVFTRADTVLAQAKLPEGDVIVVSRWHNDLKGLGKMFVALSGHPVQVQIVSCVFVVQGTAVFERELARGGQERRWTAHFRR